MALAAVVAQTKFKHALQKYKESQTSWTIFTLKLIELILCGVCVHFHIRAVVYTPEPMPHNILFCSAFGGFFILSLSGVLVPASGQVTPPGVDMVFCMCAFVLFYTSAVVAMYYVTTDEHLRDDNMTDQEEFNHPFFQHCRQHCIMSLVTGTFYLMHATFSADRLLTVKRGLSEEEADLNEPDISTHMGSMPVVDIADDTPITLHLFFFDWVIALIQSKCFQWCKETITCHGKLYCRRPVQKARPSRRISLTPHQIAALKARMEKENAGKDPEKGIIDFAKMVKATTSK